MARLVVGPGQPHARIADALAAARDGDVVAVMAGTYENDFATVDAAVTIVGVGGVAHLKATRPIPNGKAILVVRDDVVIEHLAFSGARVPDRNGAGIRHEAGNLTVRHSLFRDNENGILSGAGAGAVVRVVESEFADNGDGSGYTHGIYVNRADRLEVVDSWFHGTRVGHHIKSRAAETVVTGSRLVDGDGTASYSIDLPNGGRGLVRGNLIVQGKRAQNPALIAYGAEGGLWPDGSLRVEGNTFANEYWDAVAVLNFTETPAVLRDNAFWQVPLRVSGARDDQGSVKLQQPPDWTAPPAWTQGELLLRGGGETEALTLAVPPAADLF